MANGAFTLGSNSVVHAAGGVVLVIAANRMSYVFAPRTAFTTTSSCPLVDP